MSTGYNVDEVGLLATFQDPNKSKQSNLPTYFKLPENQMVKFRLLPRPANSPKGMVPCVKNAKHFWNNGQGGKTVMNCTLETDGECPFCNRWNQLKKDAKALPKDSPEQKAKYEEAKNYKPIISYSWTAFNDKWEMGILDLPETAHNMLGEQYKIAKSFSDVNFVSPLDIEKGNFIVIQKTKKTKAGGYYEWSYTIQLINGSSPIPAEIAKTLPEMYIYPENFMPKYTVADLNTVLSGDYSVLNINKRKETGVPTEPVSTAQAAAGFGMAAPSPQPASPPVAPDPAVVNKVQNAIDNILGKQS